MRVLRTAMMAMVAAAMGCGSDNGTGTVRVSVWGEEYIQDMIPPVMGAEAGIENGWTVRYTKFLVNLGAVRLATSASAAPSGTLAGFRVFDLHTLTGPLVIGTFSNVSAVRQADVGYALAPVDASSSAGNATAADVTLMRAGSYAVYVEGTASKAGVADVRFRWGFTGRTDFSDCHDSTEQPGVAVPTSGTASMQLTLHGDHLFYDDLQSPDARLRFDAIAAADANGDREVTLDELGAVQLTTLPMTQYSTGPLPNVRTLRDFVTHLVSTVGHFNGEGHCQERRS